MNKKYFLIIALILTLFSSFAEVAFNSYAGISMDLSAKEEDDKGLALKLNGTFVGQFSFNNAFTLRGQFVVNTHDIFENNLFQDVDATFSVKEFSATYRFITESVNQQASVFLGNFESFGSDSIIKKYFGAQNYASPVLVPTLGLNTIGMINYDGLGLGYTIKLPTPKVFGLYLYYDKNKIPSKIDSGFDYKRTLNADFRFTALWDFLILDTDFGVTLPLETTTYDKDGKEKEVVVVINYAELHGGFSMLLGNNPITNLFLQLGVTNFSLDPNALRSTFGFDNIYLFMEPRFTTKVLKCNVAFFCLPENTTQNLQFIKKPIGCNISLTSQPFVLFDKNAIAGCHLTFSTELDFSNPAVFSVQISPYLNLGIGNGELNILSTIEPTEIKSAKFFSLSVGYKNYLWK